MRPIRKAWTPAALNAVGFADSVAVGAGLTYALAATTPGDGMAHTVTFKGDAATNHSGKTVTLTGTDADGRPQTEGIAGPNGAVTVTSTKMYLTLTEVRISATTGADTFDIGWGAVSVSQTIPLEWRSNAPAGIHADISGTINYDIDQTFANVYDLAGNYAAIPWVTITAFDNQAGDVFGASTLGANAIRFKVNTITAGATMTLYASQPAGYPL